MNIIKKCLITSLIIAFLSPYMILQTFATINNITVASLFKSGAVLQRDKPISVWGAANANEQITVTYAGENTRTANVIADENGAWRLYLDAIPASLISGTLTITGSLSQKSIVLTDILIGEVWLASGQSNMQMPFSWINTEKAQSINNPNIRFFEVKTNVSAVPSNDYSTSYVWSKAVPSSVVNMSECAYYYANELYQSLNVPVGIIQSAYAGTSIEAWMSREAIANDAAGSAVMARWDGVTISQSTPSAIYNNMIYPALKYSIRGAIWYQGENNVKRADEYTTLLPSLIRSWRAEFGQGDFPFYYVQLPGYNTDASGGDWAALREAQRQALSVPNTGMAVTIDTGDMALIHPDNKSEVGRRLALLALNRTFGKKDIVDSGPFYKNSVFHRDGTVQVYFDDVTLKLVANDTILGFTLAGTDGVYYDAVGKIDSTTNSVIVSSIGAPNPKSMRYLWKNQVRPTDVSLKNAVGLPAAPFQATGDSNATVIMFEGENNCLANSDAVSVLVDSNCSKGKIMKLSANAVEDYISYTIPNIPADKYNIYVGYKGYNTRGKYLLYIDDVVQGIEQDQYSKDIVYGKADLGSKTFDKLSSPVFKFKITGKNSSSSGYDLMIDYIMILPADKTIGIDGITLDSNNILTNVKVISNNSMPKTVDVIAVLYDVSGNKLESIDMIKGYSLSQDGSVETINLNNKIQYSDGKKITILLWNSIENLMCVTKFYEYPLKK